MIQELSPTATFATLFNKINELILKFNEFEMMSGLSSSVSRIREDLIVGTPYIISLADLFFGDMTIAVTPGTLGTIAVHYRVTPTSEWIAWPIGTVAVYTEDVLEGPVDALKFEAFTTDGLVELLFLRIF